MAYYKESHELIPNALTIYRIDQPRKWWYASFRLDESKRGVNKRTRIRKSLKTTSKNDAIRKAKQEYYRMRALAEEGLPVKATSWKALRERYHNAVDYSDSTAHRLEMLDIFFGDVEDIKNINNETIGIYEKQRKKFWTTPEGKRRAKKRHARNYPAISDTTLRMEMTGLKAILKWSFKRGLIPFVPEFGFLKDLRRQKGLNYKKRGEITPEMHKAIWGEIAREHREIRERKKNPSYSAAYHTKYRMLGGRPEQFKGEVSQEDFEKEFLRKDYLNNRRMWMYIHALSKGWMIRCSTWTRLKWKDLNFEFYHEGLGKNILEIWIDANIEKTNRERFVYIIDHDTLFSDKGGTLANMLLRWKAITPYNGDDDLVFCNIDGRGARTKLTAMSRYFSALLKRLDIKKDKYDRMISAYSYRHAGISNALRKGISVFKVAQICSNSPTQIRNHYSKVKDLEVMDEFIEVEITRKQERDMARQRAADELIGNLSKINVAIAENMED